MPDHCLVYRNPDPRFHADFPAICGIMGSNDFLVLVRQCGQFSHDASFRFGRTLTFFETDAELVLLRSSDAGETFRPIHTLYRGLAYDPMLFLLPDHRLMAGAVLGDSGRRRERGSLRGVLHRHLPGLDTVISVRGIGLWFSEDGGRTWSEEPRLVSVPDWENVYNLRQAVALSDGTVLLPVTMGYPWRSRFVGLLRSWDDGVSWGDPSYVAEDPAGRAHYAAGAGYWQPALACRGDGALVCVCVADEQESAPATGGSSGLLRPSDDLPPLMTTYSVDGGFTWSPPEAIGIHGDFPHLDILPDGRLVLTYATRTSRGSAVRTCQSDDGGLTWHYGQTQREASDHLFYYPSTQTIVDGNMYTVYMAAGPDGVRYVEGVRWALP